MEISHFAVARLKRLVPDFESFIYCNEENLKMSSSGLFLLLMNQKAQSFYFLSYAEPRWRK